MSSKSKRKENKKHLCPPLTFLDKSIYFLCLVFSFLVALLLVYGFDSVRNVIAFNKLNTVAYRGNASFLLAIPFVVYLEISAFAVFIMGWESKKPIFGSKKYQYGEYPFREDCVPFFYRKKYRGRKTSSQKNFARQITALWCVGLLLFACLIPFSLFGRDVMYQDNRIEKINLMNLTSEIYTTDDFAHLIIEARYVSGYRIADYWKYEITVVMKDGKDISFSNRDFDWRVSSEKDFCLDKMLEIKSLFDSEAITIKGAENTGEVADYLGLSEAQKAKLNGLFAE